MDRAEALRHLPALAALESKPALYGALERMLKRRTTDPGPAGDPVCSPAEALVALHNIRPDRDKASERHAAN